jgi:hypothetical protein
VKKQHECFGISPLRGRFGYRGRFRSGKSPLIAPIGRRNSGEMGWSRGKRKRTPVLGVVVFRELVLGCCREGNGGEKTATHTLPEGHLFLDLIGPDLVQKMANSGTCFQNTRIMRLFQENTADYRFKMYANRRDWKADLGFDRPLLPIREQNTAMGVGFFGSRTKTMPRVCE